MTTQDKLWKAIIEEFFDDFMDFFFLEFVDQIDKTRPYVEMDKELSKIFPETEEQNRHGDKLMKVPMKGGKDQFILVHIEVQGYKDENYGRRMYVCQYRIDERYNLPVAALVIYSDKNQQNRFRHYERTTLNTTLTYTFPIFVIADKTEEEYEAMDNPFAIICQVVLMSFKTKLDDEELLKMEVQLFRKLLEKNYSKKQIHLLTVFIKEYVHFDNSEYLYKFDSETDKLTENNEPMGIVETVIQYRSEAAVKEATEKGMEKGLEKGMTQGIEQTKKYAEVVSKLEGAIEIIDNAIEKKISNDLILNILEDNYVLFAKEYIAKKSQNNGFNLLKEIKKCGVKFSANYMIDDLTLDLTTLFLQNQFSEKSIAQVLKMNVERVTEIKKQMTN